jgi:dTDP-4-dehydrorhamnose 3,5-epimerase
VGAIKLSDILVTPLKRIETDGGDVLHALKQDDIGYVDFGEAYFSLVTRGAVKAWKRHKRMTMNIVVPMGWVRFVFRSAHENGVDEFRIEEIGADRYARITVPPGVWFGFQGLSYSQSVILNIANITHDPNEVERLQISDINYVWG